MILKNVLFRSRFAFLLFNLVFVHICSRAQSNHSVIWGVNGHPITQEAYLQQQPHFKNGLVDQLNTLNYVGFKYYRVDIPINENGVVGNSERYLQLMMLAEQKGIKILPVIRLAGLDYQMSAQAAYNKGQTVGKFFTTKNGKYFAYFEIGNEEEISSLIGGGTSAGDIPSNYDNGRVKVLAAYLKGMITGIKSVKPTAKIIINTSGWVHFGYLDLLQSEGVKYDILGYHWYSEMGTMTNVRTYGFNIINVLYAKYKKPIWFTEIGRRGGSKNGGEQDQANWASIYIKEAKGNPHVQAVFFYELYDESNFEPSEEANYGLVKWGAKYIQPAYKPVVKAIRSQIRSK